MDLAVEYALWAAHEYSLKDCVRNSLSGTMAPSSAGTSSRDTGSSSSVSSPWWPPPPLVKFLYTSARNPWYFSSRGPGSSPATSVLDGH